jgi:hypothetical protein
VDHDAAQGPALLPGTDSAPAFDASAVDATLPADSGADLDALDVTAIPESEGSPEADVAVPQGPPPVIEVPPGFGHYCSVTYPDGNWQFQASADTESDPCAAILNAQGGGTIERAGLWDTENYNNYLARCNEQVSEFIGGNGIQFLNDVGAGMSAFTGCIFVVAPVGLPIFVRPYGASNGQTDPNSDVDQTNFNVFNFDIYHWPVDVTASFGEPQNPPGTAACAFDRTGRERGHYGSSDECADAGQDAGCLIMSPGQAKDWTYTWKMPFGKPVLAVADGIVRASLGRDVSNDPCSKDLVLSSQQEIYIEHQVGSGIYAENFVSVYRNLARREVDAGDVVQQGQVIGQVGDTGCATGSQLGFAVLRLTNLSGARSYVFSTTPMGYGVNGIQGAIDPFGWKEPPDASPWSTDPWAWYFEGFTADTYAPGVLDPGAWSINLWLSGEQPPTILP